MLSRLLVQLSRFSAVQKTCYSVGYYIELLGISIQIHYNCDDCRFGSEDVCCCMNPADALNYFTNNT